MLYVEMDSSGTTRHVHYAPYLDYRPLAAGEPGVEAILDRPECQWVNRELEQKAQSYAIANVVPEHLAEVRGRKLEFIAKAEAAVKERLTKEYVLGSPRRSAQAPGTGRETERQAQLRRGT